MTVIVSIGLAFMVGTLVLSVGYQMVRDLESDQENSFTKKFHLQNENEDIIYPIGTVPAELDSTLFQEE